MMTIEEMKVRKMELRYTYDMIAEKSGLPVSTVQKVLCGVSKNPRRETMEALELVLRKPTNWWFEKETGGDLLSVREKLAAYEALSEDGFLPVKKVSSKDIWKLNRWLDVEAMERWPKQGEYTADDYYALPDDVRVELIEGVIYDMASPSDTHQFLQIKLAAEFDKCIEEHGKRCIVLAAPLDVRLDGDNKTIVQPDILIMCERDNDDPRNKEVPDLVTEILSPSTRGKDCTVKLQKYRDAGVKEYWIIDPKKEIVMVYLFEEDPLPTQYSFDDTIPVGISGGECSIDFSRINKKLNDARRWNILEEKE
jgi:Uma2 family endonuclease